MVAKRNIVAAVAMVLVALSFAAAQEPLSVEDRVAALERQFARLDTRLGVSTAGGPADRDTALEARVNSLQAALDRLTADVQRAERTADNAVRDASEARRQAQDAERTARDALSRIR